MEEPLGVGEYIAAQIEDVLPRAAVYHSWVSANSDRAAMEALIEPDGDIHTLQVENPEEKTGAGPPRQTSPPV